MHKLDAEVVKRSTSFPGSAGPDSHLAVEHIFECAERGYPHSEKCVRARCASLANKTKYASTYENYCALYQLLLASSAKFRIWGHDDKSHDSIAYGSSHL
jgi:hypothetical protein